MHSYSVDSQPYFHHEKGKNMVYQQLTSETKGLVTSFLLHSVVIGFYILFLHTKSLDLMQESKTIVLEMSMLDRTVATKVVQEIPSPPEVKIEPIKPIEKPKPIVKKEMVVPLLKQEVVQPQPVQEVFAEPSPTVQSAQLLPEEVAPITPTLTSVEPYVKTDFEIIRDKVLAKLIYPSVARRMGWNGVVHVALVIDTEGKLVSASIHQSSGRQLLDDAALDAANKLKGEHLPKPKSLSTVILPIAFKLK